MIVNKLQLTWHRIITWVTCASSTRTDSTKSPGLLLLSLTRKLPFLPLSSSSFSASLLIMWPWNHLKSNNHTPHYYFQRFHSFMCCRKHRTLVN